MAKRKARENGNGFYATLNSLSTADILPVNRKRPQGKFYEVERLITCRDKDNMKEYLVKWANYSAFESTWEPENHITKDCIRLFLKPLPSKQAIEDAVTNLRIEVEKHLKSKSRSTVTLHFRGDVYRYLFNSKGRFIDGWHYLEKDEFSCTYFPIGWDMVLDSHGQGAKVHYPVSFRSSIAWSTKKYSSQTSGYEVHGRAYIEKLSFQIIKVAAKDNF